MPKRKWRINRLRELKKEKVASCQSQGSWSAVTVVTTGEGGVTDCRAEEAESRSLLLSPVVSSAALGGFHRFVLVFPTLDGEVVLCENTV